MIYKVLKLHIFSAKADDKNGGARKIPAVFGAGISENNHSAKYALRKKSNYKKHDDKKAYGSFEEEYSAALIRALRYVSGDLGKSSGKVKRLLLNKDFSPEVADRVIEELEERELIDDYRAGRRVLRRHSGKKAKGRPVMFKLLMNAGLRAETAEEVLALEYDEETALVEAVEARYGDVAVMSEDERLKAMRSLTNAGFAFAAVSEIFNRNSG